MKNVNVLLGATALLIVAGVGPGCTIYKISGAGSRSLLLNAPQGGDYDVIKHFNSEKTYTFDHTGSREIDTIVSEVLSETKADALINMRISVKITFGNYLLTMVTCGFANAQTWVVEGDAIKFRDAAPAAPASGWDAGTEEPAAPPAKKAKKK